MKSTIALLLLGGMVAADLTKTDKSELLRHFAG